VFFLSRKLEYAQQKSSPPLFLLSLELDPLPAFLHGFPLKFTLFGELLLFSLSLLAQLTALALTLPTLLLYGELGRGLEKYSKTHS
jgi:hypothetical protein